AASGHQSRPKPQILFVGDRLLRFQAIELQKLVGDAAADGLAELVARLYRLGLVALRHAAALRDDVGEDADVGQDDQQDDPEDLSETGDVPAAEEVAGGRDEQPE